MCFFSYCVYLFDKIISKIDTCIYKFISCSECIFVKYCVYFCIICTFLMFNSDGIFIIFIVFLNCVQAHIHRVLFFQDLRKNQIKHPVKSIKMIQLYMQQCLFYLYFVQINNRLNCMYCSVEKTLFIPKLMSYSNFT